MLAFTAFCVLTPQAELSCLEIYVFPPAVVRPTFLAWRTFAQLGYSAGVPLTQISTLLGHADVRTTQRYLNLALDLETTVSDFIPLSGD